MKKLGSQTAAKTILLVCPTMWDDAELPHIVAAGEYCLLIYGTDVSEHPEDFDAIDFIEQAVAAVAGMVLAGVMASDDYPGSIVAAAIASRLGLPSPEPSKVLLCHHKYYSRVAQRLAAPEAVPEFALVVGDSLADGTNLQFPFFVKPVKSFFSLFAEQVDDARQLGNLARRAERHLCEFVKPFNQLLAHYAPSPVNGSHLLAEAPLRGQQVTVEGCVFHGNGQLIGISDSIMYPGTTSFQSFEYPSVLPPDIQERMASLAFRVMHSIGFNDGLFNIEMFYHAQTDAINIIEINPRMCPQFADLMEKVNGVNTYEIALAIASGTPPVIRRPTPKYRVATSFALRVFEDYIVDAVPDADELSAFSSRFPDARLKVLCSEGERLSDGLQDGKSYRYAVLNLGGESRDDTHAQCKEALRQLPFAFTAIGQDRHVGH